MRASIRDPDPVIFLENEIMYGIEAEVSDDELNSDFILPIGKAKIERIGTDVTMTAHSKMVGFCL